MKKYISILMIALVVLSCSKSDDDNDAAAPVIDHKIVGKWQLIAENDDVPPFEWESIENGGFLQFFSNGTLMVTPDDSSCSIKTYEIVIIQNIYDQLLSYCDDELNSTIPFQINDADELLLIYPLITFKYKRTINNN
ncbi:hypothetical protein [Bizionia sp.]|uniref:hypothetical protein n=1 Tax=Bizionia sp. TaxID=1954480 RepID=UPI003A90B163